ncbi:hypothetical protein [Endozoicomonas acroporae]|uniref:hypothetical protein n=1 Tax=Endozoicomonas acroporae TaxID=1701104 RepID=UPI003D7BD226
MRKTNLRNIFAVLVACLIFGCESRQQIPEVSPDAYRQGLTATIYDQFYWPVYTLAPLQPLSDTLRIYIEGDGRAWLRSNRPSMDPTPTNRLVHHLMLKDASPDIAYLGQPCQYKMNGHCNSRVWTFGRYSKKVVETMNSVVSSLKENGGYRQLELIGYSGGGSIALLLAANRNDVISVRTVAGNLAPRYLNRYHGVSDMPTALNPESFSSHLSDIPQIHFVGSRDDIVPVEVTQHYARTLADQSCINILQVEADHLIGWIRQWPELLNTPPECIR